MSDLKGLTAARRKLEKATTIAEVRQVIDYAEAARVLAHKAQLGLQEANEATEVRMRAERKAGQMLIDMRDRAERARSGKESHAVTLSDLGVHRMESMRWQQIARLDDVRFDHLIAAPREKVPLAELSQAVFLAEVANMRYQARRARFLDSPAAYADQARNERWQMCHGDFREELAELAPGSVDAIVTDPPYGDEWLDLWHDLGAAAQNVLRPQGVLIAWSGQQRLFEVMGALQAHLRYGWTFCLQLPGNWARCSDPKILQGWKPILVYVQGSWPPHDWGSDVVTSPKREKGRYEWEQNPAPAVELIERLAGPGLVVDPFCGPGTFGIAALRAGRRFLGVEIEEARYLEACQRLKAAAS